MFFYQLASLQKSLDNRHQRIDDYNDAADVVRKSVYDIESALEHSEKPGSGDIRDLEDKIAALKVCVLMMIL